MALLRFRQESLPDLEMQWRVQSAGALTLTGGVRPRAILTLLSFWHLPIKQLLHQLPHYTHLGSRRTGAPRRHPHWGR